jgi:phage N-6-adenine-methyltransferase
MTELVTRNFAQQALAFPDRVDALLAEITDIKGRKEMLDQAATMQHYAERLKAGIEVERPIALGVLKIKAGLGELLAPASPAERGAKGGRGKKASKEDLPAFSKPTVAAYRKLAANRPRLDEYFEAIEDVPSQTDFIRWCGSDGTICTKHGNNVIEWYTPEKYLAAARKVMGSIDLDPASSKKAQKTVNAATYYTAADDGLSKSWAGTVFLNPPYKMPLIEQFCFKLCDEYESKAVTQAVLLVNDNTDTKWWHRAASTASVVCIHRGRISFYNAAGEWSSPTNGQTIFYLGRAVARFTKAFEEFGLCLKR